MVVSILGAFAAWRSLRPINVINNILGIIDWMDGWIIGWCIFGDSRDCKAERIIDVLTEWMDDCGLTAF